MKSAYNAFAGLIAHRGASQAAPENTRAALDMAAKLGARAVEIDAMLTADGQLVICHDDRLERCTDGTGYVCDHTLAALQALDAGRWFAADFAGERLLTLHDALDLCQRLGLAVNLEIKCTNGWETPTAEAVCTQLQARKQRPDLLLSSFSERAMRIVRDRLPDLPRALVVEVIPPDWQTRLAELDCRELHWCADVQHNWREADALRQDDITMRVYTIDDLARAQQCLQQGWGFFSNIPDLLAG